MDKDMEELLEEARVLVAEHPRAHRRMIEARYRANHPERCRESQKKYREKYPDRVAAKVKRWRDQNREQFNALSAKRSTQKLKATPAWADVEKIDVIYTVATWLTTCTGISHQVDHIIPLQSEVVCGLHVEYNLQVLPADANRRKSNTFPSEQPSVPVGAEVLTAEFKGV